MKKSILIGLFPLLLCACSAGTPTVKDRMANPLYADQYWTDLTERMVNIQLQQEDDIVKNPALLAIVDETRRSALQKQQEANGRVRQGRVGLFVEAREATAGAALVTQDTLFLSPIFATKPGPSLHLYLSPSLDPRDIEFPDEQSIDMGELQSPYGAQEYAMPEGVDITAFRTVTIYDTKLKRIHGFAQVQ